MVQLGVLGRVEVGLFPRPREAEEGHERAAFRLLGRLLLLLFRRSLSGSVGLGDCVVSCVVPLGDVVMWWRDHFAPSLLPVVEWWMVEAGRNSTLRRFERDSNSTVTTVTDGHSGARSAACAVG